MLAMVRRAAVKKAIRNRTILRIMLSVSIRSVNLELLVHSPQGNGKYC